MRRAFKGLRAELQRDLLSVGRTAERKSYCNDRGKKEKKDDVERVQNNTMKGWCK